MGLKLKKSKEVESLNWDDFDTGEVMIAIAKEEKKDPPYLSGCVVMRLDMDDYPLVVLHGNDRWGSGESVSHNSADSYSYKPLVSGTEFIID